MLRFDLTNSLYPYILPTLLYYSEKFTCEPRLLLGLARIHDMLNDPESAIVFYKKVLVLDASCVEAIACLGAHYFYSDQVRIIRIYIDTYSTL